MDWPSQREVWWALLWPVWGCFGLSGPLGQRPQVAVDPEALLVLSLEVARGEVRGLEGLLGVLASNRRLWNKDRLKRMASGLPSVSQALVGASWAHAIGGSTLLPLPVDPVPSSLLLGLQQGGQAMEPSWARWGWALTDPIPCSEKGLPPALNSAPALAWRLRTLLGVGAKAELLRVLASGSPGALSTRSLVERVALSKASTLEALGDLVAGLWVQALPSSPHRQAWCIAPDGLALARWAAGSGVDDRALWLGLAHLFSAWNASEVAQDSSLARDLRLRQAWGAAGPLLLATGLPLDLQGVEQWRGPGFSEQLLAAQEAWWRTLGPWLALGRPGLGSEGGAGATGAA